MYAHWFETKDVYLAALKYLSGVKYKSLLNEYKDSRWKIMHMFGNMDCNTVAFLNNEIARVCVAEDAFFNSYNRELGRVYRSYSDGKIAPPVNLDAFESYDEKRVYCFRFLRRLCSLHKWNALKEFPVVLTIPVIVGMLGLLETDDVWPAIENCRKSQQYIHGGYCGISAEKWENIKTDADLFNAVFSSVGEKKSWPEDFVDRKSCYVKGRRVRILVDGENFRAASADYFLNNDLQVLECEDIRVDVFDDSKHTKRWDLAASRCKYEMHVEPVEKVVESKSLVDCKIRDAIGRYYYRDNIRDFCILSSDSDFVNLIDTYPDARFLFVCFRSSTSLSMCKKIINQRSYYRYFDDSLSFRNEKVYATERLIMRASATDGNIASDEELWNTFCEENGYKPDSPISRSARFRLLNDAVVCGG